MHRLACVCVRVLYVMIAVPDKPRVVRVASGAIELIVPNLLPIVVGAGADPNTPPQ